MITKRKVTIKPNNLVKHFYCALLFQQQRIAIISHTLSTSDILIYTSQGKLIHTASFLGRAMEAGAMNSTQLLLLITQSKQWIILNCFTFESRAGTFQFESSFPFNNRMVLLRKSNIVCVWSVLAGGHVKLMLYRYPFEEKAQSFSEMEIIQSAYLSNPAEVHQLNQTKIVAYHTGMMRNIKWVTVDCQTLIYESYQTPKLNEEVQISLITELKADVFMIGVRGEKESYYVFEKEKPLRQFSSQLPILPYKILPVGDFIYVFGSRQPSGESHLISYSKQTQNQVLETTIPTSNTKHFTTHTTDRQEILVVDVQPSYFNPTTITIQSLKNCSQVELYIHILREISSNKMTISMIEEIINQFHGDFL